MADQTLSCTWYIEARKNKADEIVPGHPCGRTASVTYSKLNPRRRHPDEPRMLVHPRCDTHDTPAAQRAAPDQGYERIVL